MGKQELKRKETAVVSPNGEGKQYEQTLTVDVLAYLLQKN